MLKAKEIMQTELLTISEDAPIVDAINIFGKKKITGLPVVDGDMNLLGIVSEKDVLMIAYRIIVDSLDLGSQSKKISDIMTRDVISFSSDTNLADICQCFLSKPFRRVPIVDDGKLVGLISRKDIVAHAFEKTCS